jgi:hypothetical protein
MGRIGNHPSDRIETDLRSVTPRNQRPGPATGHVACTPMKGVPSARPLSPYHLGRGVGRLSPRTPRNRGWRGRGGGWGNGGRVGRDRAEEDNQLMQMGGGSAWWSGAEDRGVTAEHRHGTEWRTDPKPEASQVGAERRGTGRAGTRSKNDQRQGPRNRREAARHPGRHSTSDRRRLTPRRRCGGGPRRRSIEARFARQKRGSRQPRCAR